MGRKWSIEMFGRLVVEKKIEAATAFLFLSLGPSCCQSVYLF